MAFVVLLSFFEIFLIRALPGLTWLARGLIKFAIGIAALINFVLPNAKRFFKGRAYTSKYAIRYYKIAVNILGNTKVLSFQQSAFSATPYILLTAEHKVLGQKHDAATVWVENAKKDGFTACLREMQNFDGLHENIAVVSLTEIMNRK